jgi:hypothetical protein
MASPRAHTIASIGLLAVAYIVGFYVGFILRWMDIMWMIIFGVLIDIDHLPSGRLWTAFRSDGLSGVKKSWKENGWLDADHLNFMHTRLSVVVVIVFSAVIGNFWPFVAYAIHIVIDGGSISSLYYPKCSPLTRDIHLSFSRFYPKWALYHTAGVPPPKRE